MLFIQVKNETIVQTDDKTRIDISKSFISGVIPDIVKYEIQPEASASFEDVTEDMRLDWVYDTDGDKVITVKATDDLAVEYTKTATISIITDLDDNLFSSDADIVGLEPDLLQWVQDGRNSFTDKHREAQREILNELDAARIWKDDGDRYASTDIVDLVEFRDWSKYVALRIIFEGISNAIDDVFSIKATKYQSHAVQAKKRATFRLDSNGDGVDDIHEQVDNVTSLLVRR